MKTHSMSIIGELRAGSLCLALVRNSQWFEVTPLPFDHWEFKVKEENAGLLQQLLTAVYDANPLMPGEGEETDE